MAETIEGTADERALLEIFKASAAHYAACHVSAAVKFTPYGGKDRASDSAAHAVFESYVERKIRIAHETGQPLQKIECCCCGKMFTPPLPPEGSTVLRRFCSPKCESGVRKGLLGSGIRLGAYRSEWPARTRRVRGKRQAGNG